MMIIAGFGFRTIATVDALQNALELTGHAHEIAGFATATDKAGSPALIALAQRYDVPIHAIAKAHLGATDTPTQSPRVQARYGTGSVAEAAALAAIGNKAQLLQTRVTSADGTATAAIAQGEPE